MKELWAVKKREIHFNGKSNVGNLIFCILAIMKGNPRVNLRNPSRHRFCDQKNKLQVPQASKPNNSKTIVTRAQARQRRSPSNSTRNDSVQSLPHSPKAEVVKPVELRFLPFSKSEEDTRAEHDDQSDSILSREPCW